MTRVIADRMTAQIDGDFVVFLLGLKVNAWWKLHKWLPLMAAMPRMIRELESLPSEQTGFLGRGAQSSTVMVQYWRSFAHLEAYAKAPDKAHFPAWGKFNRTMKMSLGDVGIWHETYLVQGGAYEAVYSGMPPTGLGKFGQLIPATGAAGTARGRLGPSAPKD